MATNRNQASGTETNAEKTSTSTNKDTYIVKDGDSLESVARENNMEPVELMRLNPEIDASGSNNNMLYTGQEIRLK